MVLKQDLRKEFLEKRNSLLEYEVTKRSQLIQSKFFELDIYKKCDYIFTYVNMGSEVKTIEIIKQAFKDNKKVAVPKILRRSEEMIFVEISFLNELVKGTFNTLEPISCKKVLSTNNTIILIPGLVFDKRNYRIGYGGGYYDKYLYKSKSLAKIGLAYNFQVIDSIPKDKYDIPVDFIITD